MEEDDKGCLMIRLGVSGCFFWYRPTRVVPDQRPLNGCVCVCAWPSFLELLCVELDSVKGEGLRKTDAFPVARPSHCSVIGGYLVHPLTAWLSGLIWYWCTVSLTQSTSGSTQPGESPLTVHVLWHHHWHCNSPSWGMSLKNYSSIQYESNCRNLKHQCQLGKLLTGLYLRLIYA